MTKAAESENQTDFCLGYAPDPADASLRATGRGDAKAVGVETLIPIVPISCQQSKQKPHPQQHTA